MSVSRKYNLEIEIIVDDEDAEVLKRLDERYADGRMKYTATHGIISNISYYGKAGIYRGILKRNNIEYGAGFNCDHINHNNGDNRLENLQVLSASENQRKARDRKKSYSQYYGVTWCKSRNKWKAVINTSSTINLGYYTNEADAAKAYDSYVYFNKLNRKLNFPDSTEETHKHHLHIPRTPTSSYYGIYWSKRDRKWRARIYNGNEHKNIGYFTDEVEAAKAYDAKVKELKLDKKLNFPDNDTDSNDQIQQKEMTNDPTVSTIASTRMGTDETESLRPVA